MHIYNTMEGTYFNAFKLSNNYAIAGCIFLNDCLLIEHFIVLDMWQIHHIHKFKITQETGIIPTIIGMSGANIPRRSIPHQLVVNQSDMHYDTSNLYLMQERIYVQAGKVTDAVETFIDLYFRDKGCKLHNNPLPTELCTKHLRKYTKTTHAKTEAFSITLQELGTLGHFRSAFNSNSPGKFKFSGTKKHLDGPKDLRHKYLHTFVLSTLIEKNGMVYRLTIILYSRALVGSFLLIHGPTRTFVQFIKKNRRRNITVTYIIVISNIPTKVLTMWHEILITLLFHPIMS